MTHGGTDGMLTARDHKYNLDVLWAPFKPSKCPSLAGKPKIFIIQVVFHSSSLFKKKICTIYLFSYRLVVVILLTLESALDIYQHSMDKFNMMQSAPMIKRFSVKFTCYPIRQISCSHFQQLKVWCLIF